MANGKINGGSANEMEHIRKEIKSLSVRNESNVDLLATDLEISSIISRIRNRVSKFARIVENSFLQTQLEDNAILENVINITAKKVFIGHGRSLVWRDLKDFISERLKLPYDEFNREPTAGKSTKERLEEMLNESIFAFLIMTAEDEHADNTLHARENVIHEIGLFQGKLGFSKAIVLLEEGCETFSNIHGLTQIRFPKNNILAKSEELRRVLERENVINSKET